MNFQPFPRSDGLKIRTRRGRILLVRTLLPFPPEGWEYHPGSTLYFVRTQERDGFDQFGDFNFNRDRSALFRDRPTNVFQIKGTYWIGR